MRWTSLLRSSAAAFKRPLVTSETGFTGAIGNTPLIKLNKLSEETGCNIYAKGEYMNPGASVKDRPALYIIQDAEKKGELGPGGTVVEGTAGNTGIGLAHMCRARGYKCVIFLPATQSKAKINMLKLLGAEVHGTPVVPVSDPQNFNQQAERYAKGRDNTVWTNQFNNLANRQSHIETTGPEIWKQTNGKLDAFICATGTGGSLSGITHYLKEASNGKVKSYLSDPPGSVLYNYITSGKIEPRGVSSYVEGVGQGRVTENLKADADKIDGAFFIDDNKSLAMLYRLLDDEGLFVGGSSGVNVASAYELAKQLGPGHTIVTLLCDSAERYAYRLFSESWLKENGLYDAIPEHLKHYIVLP